MLGVVATALMAIALIGMSNVHGTLAHTAALTLTSLSPSVGGTVCTLDLFITPQTDPGPDSNVYGSNQVNSLHGYASLELVSACEGVATHFNPRLCCRPAARERPAVHGRHGNLDGTK